LVTAARCTIPGRALCQSESPNSQLVSSSGCAPVTIWFHQALDVVDEAVGNAALERRFAREVGMRVTRLPSYPGSATSWQAHSLRGTTPFVVELHAGALSGLEVRRFVGALRSLGGADSDGA
jgi:hypothetical protein